MLVRRAALPLAALLAAIPLATAASQQPSPDLYRGMRWRMIGPHRGGRTKAAVGVPGQPNVFYIGATNGGVWRTTDVGRTWTPLFDHEPTNSVGAIAVAPSSPNVLYVGSGEGLQRPDLSTGDGIYRSADSGATWTHLGLHDGQQIPQIAVDPTNPDRLFVAVLGHPYGPNAERGIFRSTDGGRSFQKVLYKDENTGGIDVVLDPRNPRTIYAALWAARQAPWENGNWNGPASGLFKSTDGGDTWRQLAGGLPTPADGLGRLGIGIAPSDPSRIFVTADVKGAGLIYRSDDAGETWRRITTDPRPASRPSDFAEIKVDPRDRDVVYTASVVAWKSTDGGVTWNALRGAPGGDDYHRIWLSPEHPGTILIAADQGAVITVNGGRTWSSWYNQPTAQFYHVSTDNAYPYRVCGGQQESGSVCIQSRGDYGAITFREWTPVGVEEYGYVAPDPLDPDVVYGGKVSRWDRRTRQVEQVAPRSLRSPDYRVLRTAPVLFSPVNPRALYFASNVVWRTTTGGRSWTQLSPDLTRTDSTLPPNVGTYASTAVARARHPGVVYSLGLSPLSERTIWAGTDDGLIHLTTDGGATWTNVTPAQLRDRPWSKISLVEPSHTRAGTAYAAVNTFRLDDLRPHVYRTRDAGRSWQEIVAGIDSGAVINAVREDPVRPGLLYAGSETGVWVSFDDGDHWQSLRLNMPASSIRDLVVKDDDLVVGTHGRSFWILDDVTPLRQAADSVARAAAFLFRPQTATRTRWNANTDTPLPPDEPMGENPPDGAILDYWLRDSSGTALTIEIADAAGRVVRRYASTDTAQPVRDVGNVPRYWIRPTQVPSTAAGMHRFVWDLHLAPPRVDSADAQYPIAAVEMDTPREPRGPYALPGRYTVRLTTGGRTLTQPLVVRMDPRVRTSAADLARQYALSVRLRDAIGEGQEALDEISRVRAALRPAGTDTTAMTPEMRQRDGRLASIEGPGRPGSPAGTTAPPGDLGRIQGELSQLYELVQSADAAPTPQAAAAVEERLARQRLVLRRWEAERRVGAR